MLDARSARQLGRRIEFRESSIEDPYHFTVFGHRDGDGYGQGIYSNISCVYQKISGFWRSMLSTLRKVIEETLTSFGSSGQ